MKTTIFSKIFAGYFIIITILTVSILVFTFQTVRKHYLNTLTNNLQNLAVSLNLRILPMLEYGHNQSRELNSLVKKLGKDISTRVTVVDATGRVLADSETDPVEMENLRTRPEIRDAMNGKTGKSLRLSTILKEEMLYVAIPVEKDGRMLGVLRVSLFLRDINGLLGDLKMNIIKAAGFVTFVSLLLALVLSRGISYPVRRLAEASRRIAGGEFDVKVDLKNKDEMKILSDSFNEMTSQIKNLFMELSLQKENLHHVISSIREGLVVLNREGRVVFCNDSFISVTGRNEVEGRFYREVLSEPDFGELINNVINEKRNIIKEMEINSRVFLCSATFLHGLRQVVVILHDITEIKRLEILKKQFVANVSHELRTPLTAIKGFAETLLDDEKDDVSRHYLEILLRHTDRLIKIVSELLLLSNLEEKGTQLELEDVYLGKMTGNVLKLFEQRLREKDINLNMEISDNLPPVRAELLKIEQMFINLIDNAIKYTDKGEIRVSLRLRDKQVIIEIQDTGLGIPREHVGHVFEEFYVVDKSRSKKLGGTGLGLAIVKDIVHLHKGTISVESVPGKGTKFTVILPVNPCEPIAWSYVI